MTKRPCPFENHLIRQSKVHLNNYENDEKTLKDLQERTITRLIHGSKRFYSNETQVLKTGNDANFNVIQQCKDDRRFMQKSLTNYFPSGGMLSVVKSSSILNQLNPNKCSFCDKQSASLNKCVTCLEFFCPSCTFTLYDLIDYPQVCMSCS